VTEDRRRGCGDAGIRRLVCQDSRVENREWRFVLMSWGMELGGDFHVQYSIRINLEQVY
jgi:hypothetical protein